MKEVEELEDELGPYGKVRMLKKNKTLRELEAKIQSMKSKSL